MNDGPSTQLVLAGAIGLAVAVILGLVVTAWLMGRYYRWMFQNMPSIRHEYKEIYRLRGPELALWRNRGWLFAAISWLLIIVPIAMGYWFLVPVLFVLLLPLGLIFGGLQIVQTQHYWDNSPFRPIRLITGEPAVRRGRILVAVGTAILVLCALLVLSTVVQVLV